MKHLKDCAIRSLALLLRVPYSEVVEEYWRVSNPKNNSPTFIELRKVSRKFDKKLQVKLMGEFDPEKEALGVLKHYKKLPNGKKIREFHMVYWDGQKVVNGDPDFKNLNPDKFVWVIQ